MHTSYQTQTRNKPIQQNEKLTMNVVAPRLQMHQIYVTTLRKKACTMEHTYVPRRPCWHWYIAWSNWFAPKTVKPASQIGQLCIFYGCWLKISKNWAGPTLGLSPWLLQPLYRMALKNFFVCRTLTLIFLIFCTQNLFSSISRVEFKRVHFDLIECYPCVSILCRFNLHWQTEYKGVFQSSWVCICSKKSSNEFMYARHLKFDLKLRLSNEVMYARQFRII